MNYRCRWQFPYDVVLSRGKSSLSGGREGGVSLEPGSNP